MTNQQKMRVRFAPSPTGFLHVGGARTALFNYLLAKRHNGVFVLRIEDTDRARSSGEMTQAILDSMQWLGLQWDEGPFHQADGVEQHKADALRLFAEGKAYRCFCSQEEAQARRKEGEFGYDNYCRQFIGEASEAKAKAGQKFAIRYLVPEGKTAWTDAVHDFTEFDNSSIEDFIILRSDGTPIYNMAVVSDDVAMEITHVIRGDDHISNTPKQILLYRALGHEPPTFAHVPMILGPDGKRLSKRHGATAVGEYQTQGILPEAMNNFLLLLGWNPGTEQEIFTLDEMVQAFALEAINKKSAVFDTTKLEWMNSQYLQRMSADEIEARIADDLKAIPGWEQTPKEWRHKLIDLLKVRSRTLQGVADLAKPYLRDDVEFDQVSVDKVWKDRADAASKIEKVRDRINDVEWNEKALEEAIRSVAEEVGVGAGKVIHPLRVAVTGTAASPGMFEVLVLLGRERVLERIKVALDMLRERQ
ncbi:MAG TPA: glutamate--tRNA ligase [Longimicrobiales bacterium]|nr:glutamate--tRNA ligase [Longimicrobiales bacterium]